MLSLQLSLSHTPPMFIMFIHRLIMLSGQHISGNLPEPGTLGCGHRARRRLPWALLLTGEEEKL